MYHFSLFSLRDPLLPCAALSHTSSLLKSSRPPAKWFKFSNLNACHSRWEINFYYKIMEGTVTLFSSNKEHTRHYFQSRIILYGDFFHYISLFKKCFPNFFIADLFVILYYCIKVMYFDYCSILCEQNHCMNVIASQSIVSCQFYQPLIGINNTFKEIDNYYEQVGTGEHAVYLIFSRAYEKY